MAITYRQDNSPSIASCSSVLVYVNLPPTTVPTKYTSHARRPNIEQDRKMFRVVIETMLILQKILKLAK